MGALDAAISQMQTDGLASGARPPRRWNRGVAIRFVLAIAPTVVFAALGALQQHSR